jgi:hypothetical protein
MRGAKHDEAAAICDKVVFSKVVKIWQPMILD